jgi:hypothetical protein
MHRRSESQRLKDFLTFPLRALTLFFIDRWGLSSLASERYDYVNREIQGYCLDVGCENHNCFINEYLDGAGRGIDVYPYEGLISQEIVQDMTQFPFENDTFFSVTFIANLNNVPKSVRDAELSEDYRVLKRGGNIIITMGNPVAEVLVHKLVAFYDRVLGARYDIDAERGMNDEEE